MAVFHIVAHLNTGSCSRESSKLPTVNVKEVRELEGLLREDGMLGLIASSGGFNSVALQEIRSSSRHIETMISIG